MDSENFYERFGPEKLREFEKHRASLVNEILDPHLDLENAGADQIIRRLSEIQSCIQALREVLENIE